jgi:molybdopterin-guanine dinucleotide biosynthesis protein A
MHHRIGKTDSRVKIDTFILIGGRSSRLGRDKAFIELSGQTLAERALRTATNAFPTGRITFVAGNHAQFGIESARVEAPFVFDLVEDRGPLGGLHSALSYAQTEWIFVLACDIPFVTADLLQLIAGFTTGKFGAVAPEQPDGRLQPLCAVYRVAVARPVIDDIIQKPRVPPPLHEIVRQLEPRIVKPDEYTDLAGAELFFTNINTTDELAQAQKRTQTFTSK